ncbi:MAG: ArsR/SmtB family transcription factor [Myxococcota bacterium]
MTSREQAAADCLSMMDGDFLKSFAEPARVEIIRVLVLHGRSDVGTIASHLPQDRSVVARHLQNLARSGIVRAESEGRHTFYQLDGPAIQAQLNTIQQLMAHLVPVCCP